MYPFLIIFVVAIITALLRFLPFLIFSGKRETPKFILYLGKVLPYAIMAMLVVYCLKGISFMSAPFGLPELIASAAVIVIHLLKKNTLISISLGTIIYMVLIQFVF